jgi:hypothetical protein
MHRNHISCSVTTGTATAAATATAAEPTAKKQQYHKHCQHKYFKATVNLLLYLETHRLKTSDLQKCNINDI